MKISSLPTTDISGSFFTYCQKLFLLFSDGANLLADRSYCRSVKSFYALQSFIEQEKSAVKADYDSNAVHLSDFVQRLVGSLD